MPRLTQFFIRTALIWLVISVVVGGLMMLNHGLGWNSWLGVLQPVFYHGLMVGWVTQLICGVALWLFPVHSREQPRGNEQIAWASYGLLNIGLLVRVVAEPWQMLAPNAVAGWSLVLSALMQASALWLFVLVIWPRVKGKPNLPRRATAKENA